MTEIKFNDLPIDESFVGKDDDELKVVYERTESDLVKVICFAPQTEHEVLTAFITISTGSTKVDNLDTNFWDVTLDGEPIETPTFKKFGGLRANVTAKDGKYLIELKSS